MKIWTGYGSEHSANLVLVGTFKDATAAASVKERFDQLADIAMNQLPERDWEDPDPLFSKEVRDLLKSMSLWDVGRTDLEAFAYDHGVRLRGERIELTTEETDIQGFIKVLLSAGARIEVYSAHTWNEDGSLRTAEPGDAEAAAVTAAETGEPQAPGAAAGTEPPASGDRTDTEPPAPVDN